VWENGRTRLDYYDSIAPVAFGQMQVLPRLKRFLDRYRDIKIDLTMSDHFVDLVGEGIDLAIRIGKFVDPT
jgi:DNA-binding transcriptional LysR family regulator